MRVVGGREGGEEEEAAAKEWRDGVCVGLIFAVFY